MQDRPLILHCSGLGGGLFSPNHDYDVFFQNHAQMKSMGPLAMINDWEQRVAQLGLTKIPISMRYISSLPPRLGGVYGESSCQQNLLTISFCSLERCAS